MGIDGIGRKGTPPPPEGASGPSHAPTGQPFEVSKSASALPVPESAEVGHPILDRLRRGEIDVEGYVEAKVEEATVHLGPLPAARLAEIRGALRDRVLSDPTLADLVRTAAGTIPSPAGDD